jgi:hypothetical protein
VLLLATDDVSSIRALRFFLQLSPWPEAAAGIAGCGVGKRSTDLQRLAGYCALHYPGIDLISDVFREPADVFSWADQERVDLIVTGWAQFRPPVSAPSVFVIP